MQRGRNSRLDSIQAAVLGAKLPNLDKENTHRRSIMELYRAWLPAPCEPLRTLPLAEAVHHLAVVRVSYREDAGRALSQLDQVTAYQLSTPVPQLVVPPYSWREAASLRPWIAVAAGALTALVIAAGVVAVVARQWARA